MHGTARYWVAAGVCVCMALGVAAWADDAPAARESGSSGSFEVAPFGPGGAEQKVPLDYVTPMPPPTPNGMEWGGDGMVYTPKGNRPYLGNFFPKDSPALVLDRLPPHKRVHVTFDLILGQSWDGNSTAWGNSIWTMGADDGRTLIHCTFSNCGFFVDNNEQTYPDSYPSMPYQGFSLAKEDQTLGVMKNFGGGPERTFDCSSVYHMDLSFPHTDNKVVLQFKSKIRDGSYKYYGFANVHSDYPAELKAFSEAELGQLWKDLGSGVPEVFDKAHRDLISAGNPAAVYISKHLDEKIDVTDAQLQALADAVKGASGEKKVAAYFDLRQQGPRALPLIQAMAAKYRPDLESESPEAPPPSGFLHRMEAFIQLADSQYKRYPQTATEARLQRARWVLDAIHTPLAAETEKKIKPSEEPPSRPQG